MFALSLPEKYGHIEKRMQELCQYKPSVQGSGMQKLVNSVVGMARFRPLSLPLALPGPDASPADWAHFNDALWSLQITCCLLPDMRYDSQSV